MPLSLPSFEEIGIHVTAYNLVSSWKGWAFRKLDTRRDQLWQRGCLEAIDVELRSKGWTELGRQDLGEEEAGSILGKENGFEPLD